MKSHTHSFGWLLTAGVLAGSAFLSGATESQSSLNCTSPGRSGITHGSFFKGIGYFLEYEKSPQLAWQIYKENSAQLYGSTIASFFLDHNAPPIAIDRTPMAQRYIAATPATEGGRAEPMIIDCYPRGANEKGERRIWCRSYGVYVPGTEKTRMSIIFYDLPSTTNSVDRVAELFRSKFLEMREWWMREYCRF